ncbi:MAG TPA: hypothetical protein VII61_11660, partial [Ktedonobacteraceae bacterium]
LPKHQTEPQIIEPDRSLWSNYCGSYLGTSSGLAKIEAVDDHLILKQNDTVIPLQAIRNDLYIGKKTHETTLIAVGFPPSDGPTPYIYVNSFVHKRAELTITPDPDIWKNYEGTYILEGIDTYTIRIAEEELLIASKNDNLEIVLTPVDATRFGCRWGLFEFLSNDAGKVFAIKQGTNWLFTKV